MLSSYFVILTGITNHRTFKALMSFQSGFKQNAPWSNWIVISTINVDVLIISLTSQFLKLEKGLCFLKNFILSNAFWFCFASTVCLLSFKVYALQCFSIFQAVASGFLNIFQVKFASLKVSMINNHWKQVLPWRFLLSTTTDIKCFLESFYYQQQPVLLVKSINWVINITRSSFTEGMTILYYVSLFFRPLSHARQISQYPRALSIKQISLACRYSRISELWKFLNIFLKLSSRYSRTKCY